MKSYELKSKIRPIYLICVVVGIVLGICLSLALVGAYGMSHEAAMAAMQEDAERHNESAGNGSGWHIFGLLILGMPIGGIVGACLGYWVAFRMTHKYRVLLDENRASRA